jgi:formylmethanofuran dehydrogenase subunit E-like metal-binding protein
MKRIIGATSLIIVLSAIFFCHVVSAASFKEAVSQAMANLAVSKNDAALLMLTDAPYVKADGGCALPYLDQAQELTGCTVGKGNLLFFQRPQAHPLRLMLYKKKSGQAVIISRVEQTWMSETLNLSAQNISTPEFWEKAKTLQAGNDMFTLAAIANVWAKDGPYDFLKSAELIFPLRDCRTGL